MIAVSKKRPNRQVCLRGFYRNKLRRQLSGKSKGYQQNFKYAVDYAEKFQQSVLIDQIDEKWLKDFATHLKAGGGIESFCKQQCWLVRRVVRYYNPYRFMRGARSAEILTTFKAEPTVCLGSYFANVFAPSDTRHRGHYSAVVAFVNWCGRAIRLSEIDDKLLDCFENAERERLAKPHSALIRRALVGQIINAWKPGTIQDRRKSAPILGGPGTVQHSLAEIASQEANKRNAEICRTVATRLTKFEAGTPMPWERFTVDKAVEFLEWAVDSDDGESLQPHYVNCADRWVLNRASHVATEQGLIKRPLQLLKLPEPGRSTRPRVSGTRVDRGTKRTSPLNSRAGVGGRRIAWPAAVDFLLSKTPEDLAATATKDLREQFRSTASNGEMPPKNEFRALVSRARNSKLPKRSNSIFN